MSNVEVRKEVGIKQSSTASIDTDQQIDMSWTWEDLQKAQRDDPEIGHIVKWLSEKSAQPPWSEVTINLLEPKHVGICGHVSLFVTEF